VSAPVLTYRGGFAFDLPPERLWAQIEQFDRYETWWPWLSALRIEGGELAAGSVLHGVVSPPVPYRMQVDIDLVGCVRPHAVDADVAGDLVGPAHLRIRSEGEGSRVEVSWALEMRQPAMRWAFRFGRPLLQWGHDRVVEMTVAGFRRRIEGLSE
jgi:hypothetical protein